jgi:AhpD family alkylhydroperoxidase
MLHLHSEDKSYLDSLKQLAPIEFASFVLFDSIVARENGDIPPKYRELIAIAVACTTQCEHCLGIHSEAAKRAGATPTEVAEAALLAAALRAGAVVAHGATALKLFEGLPEGQQVSVDDQADGSVR